MATKKQTPEMKILNMIRKELQNMIPAPVAPIAPVLPVAPIFTDQIIYKLGRIESLLEELKDQMVKHIDDDDVLHADLNRRTSSLEKQVPEKLEARLSSLERSRSWTYGAVAVLSAAATLLSNFLYHWVMK